MSHSGKSSGGSVTTSRTPAQEKHRLREELEKRGIVDESSVDKMKELLDVLVATEQTDKSEEKNAERNSSPVALSPSGQQSYSDKLKLDNDRKSKNLELSLDQSSKSLSREKHIISLDELIQGGNKMKSNFRSTEWKENPRTNTNKGRRLEKLKLEEKQPVLKLTSQDFHNEEQGQRLIARYQLADKKSSQDGKRMTKASENAQGIFDRLRKHLFQTAEISHNQRTSSLALNNQWGTAIKVDETNASFEREMIADEETTPLFNDNTNQPETSTSYSFAEGTTRRRKRNTNAVAIYEFADDDSEENQKDDSDDGDFQLSAKRQKTARSSNQRKAKSSKIAPKKTVESTATRHSVQSSYAGKESEDRPLYLEVLDEWADTDDAPSNKLEKSESEKTEAFCPRRIVPPNPAGKKWAKIRARRPLYNSSSELRVHDPTENDGNSESAGGLEKSDNNSSLQEDEIARALEISDESDESQAIIPLECELAAVRPLKMSCRMKMQAERLVKINEEEKEKEAIRREEERIKDEIKLNEKSRRVAQRIREESEKMKQQEAEEKRQAQREENWRNLIAQGSKQRLVERTELHPDGRPAQNEQTVNRIDKNNSPMELSDDEFITDTGNARDNNSNQRVTCPICNRRFDADAIEAHAGACEEYDSCPPGISRSSSPSLTPPRIPKTSRSRISTTFECQVCQNFSTESGKDFENHSHECVKRQKYGQSSTPDSVIQVSNSPIRSVRTISELSDSEIDYKSQFAPKTKSNKTAKRGKRRL